MKKQTVHRRTEGSPPTQNHRGGKKIHPILLVFIVVFGLNIITAAVLTPIFVKVATDITYADSFLPDIIYYAVGFINIVTLFFCYGSIIYAICTRSLKSSLPYTFIALGGLIFNYAISFTFDYFGYVNGMPAAVILQTLAYFGINFAAECIKIFLIILFAVLSTKRHKRVVDRPAWKIFERKNPFFISMLFTAMLFVLIAILTELPDTIDHIKEYGRDIRPNEIVSIIYAYISVILSGAIGYFVMIFAALSLDSKRRT